MMAGKHSLAAAEIMGRQPEKNFKFCFARIEKDVMLVYEASLQCL